MRQRFGPRIRITFDQVSRVALSLFLWVVWIVLVHGAARSSKDAYCRTMLPQVGTVTSGYEMDVPSIGSRVTLLYEAVGEERPPGDSLADVKLVQIHRSATRLDQSGTERDETQFRAFVRFSFLWGWGVGRSDGEPDDVTGLKEAQDVYDYINDLYVHVSSAGVVPTSLPDDQRYNIRLIEPDWSSMRTADLALEDHPAQWLLWYGWQAVVIGMVPALIAWSIVRHLRRRRPEAQT